MDALLDRLYVSRYGSPTLGIQTYRSGAFADADGNQVLVTMTPEGGGVAIFTDRLADHPETGVYTVTLSSVETQTPGDYALRWDYSIDGVPQMFESNIEIGPSAPAYDALAPDMQTVVEGVLAQLGDLFDSPLGGPHLQVYFQTHFGRQRVAQLLANALGSLNIVAQPHTTYTLDPSNNRFPLEQWGALLSQALLVEVISHLRRSYVEQPAESGLNVAYDDRRDYMQRWGEVLRDEQAELKDMLDHFKIAHMGLSSPRVLVSGGVYGNYGPVRMPSSAAARPRYWMRFH